jgi:hypothetical protein
MTRILCLGFLLILCILLSYPILHEKFTNLSPSKLNYVVGSYDKQKLTNCPNDLWKHPPSNEGLRKNRFVPLGHTLPLTDIYTTQGSIGPSVDGTDESPNNMFMFAYNECKPECCPSTYSCDGGCVCTTKKQRRYVAGRGNNKTITQNNEY